METIMANGLNWLNKHVPGLGFITFLMVSVIWVTVMITNFTHRLSETERKCDDIRADMDQWFSKVDERLDKVDARLDKVDARLNKVDERLDKVDERLLKVEEKLQKIEIGLEKLITHIETKEGIKLKSP